MATQSEVNHGAADAASVGMPQLDFSTFPNQIFWLIITLAVIYLILSRVALPNISQVLALRANTIANNVAMADEMRKKASDAEKAYEKALQDARTEAARISADMRADIQRKLDKELEKADAQIAEKSQKAAKALSDIRDATRQNVREVATATTHEIVLAMGDKSDKKSISNAVEKQMKE